ncbi:MAG: hypothetical protein SNH45_07450, partial [Rikenellaceae bacterium]
MNLGLRLRGLAYYRGVLISPLIMEKVLIKKEFRLGSELLKEWLRENMDIDILAFSGIITDSDYAMLCDIDIMGDDIGLTSLDMGRCLSNICLWSCYPRSANSRLKQLILPNGIRAMHTTFEWCENVLEEAVLPNTLLIIGGFSFSYANLK